MVKGGTRVERCFACMWHLHGSVRVLQCCCANSKGQSAPSLPRCARARAAARQEQRGVAVLGVLQLLIPAAADLLGSVQASIAPQLARESCCASCGVLL